MSSTKKTEKVTVTGLGLLMESILPQLIIFYLVVIHPKPQDITVLSTEETFIFQTVIILLTLITFGIGLFLNPLKVFRFIAGNGLLDTVEVFKIEKLKLEACLTLITFSTLVFLGLALIK